VRQPALRLGDVSLNGKIQMPCPYDPSRRRSDRLALQLHTSCAQEGVSLVNSSEDDA
jgi:hypothetical protein